MVIKTKCAFRSNFFIDGLFVDFFFFGWREKGKKFGY